MWVIDVGEMSRIDGSIEGGYKIDIFSEDDLKSTIAEFEAALAEEEISDRYPFHSFVYVIEEFDLPGLVTL